MPDMYKGANKLVPRAIKQLIKSWGVDIEVYRPTSSGILGKYDTSRIEYEQDSFYSGRAFIPSIMQKRKGNSALDNLSIFQDKSPRMFTEEYIDFPDSSLVVVRNFRRVLNFIINMEDQHITNYGDMVYGMYELVPHLVIDSRINADELQEVSEVEESVAENELVNLDIDSKPSEYTTPVQSTDTTPIIKQIRLVE